MTADFSLGIIRNIFDMYDIKDVDYYQNSSDFMEAEKNYDIYI